MKIHSTGLRLICLAVTAVATLAALAVAPSATAVTTATWTPHAVPPPPVHEPHAEFASVSCPTATRCLGVGDQINGQGFLAPLVESWTPGGWVVRSAPQVGGVSTLDQISCATGSWCMAVGRGSHDRVVRWDGTGWTATTVQDGRRAHLTAASCATRVSCLMIGRLAGHAAAWRWTGSRWNLVAVPHADRVTLAAVSCPSAGLCYAVGSFRATTAPRRRVAVEKWDAGGLRRVRLHQPVHGTLTSIACPATTACTATGAVPGVETANDDAILVADLAGGSWRVSRPQLSGTFAELGPVSCRSRRVCTAVVDYLGNDELATTVAVRGRTGGFHMAHSSYPGLVDVSCARADCTVVGHSVADNRGSGDVSSIDRPVAVRGPAATLARQHPQAPAGATDRTLEAVSCVAGGFCAATTGGMGAAGHYAIYTRSGGRWHAGRLRHATAPSAVACLSATFCMAVGHHESLRWDGSRWTTGAMPVPDGRAHDTVLAVSCAAIDWCDAVGTTGDESLQRAALVEHWDGSAWRVVSAPTLPGTNRATTLSAISCTSTSYCLAVGHDVISSRPLVERWNGTRWAIVTAAGLPAKADLDSVSCWSAHECMLTANTGRPVPYAGRWDGTRFTATPLSHPAGAGQIVVAGLSCVSAHECTAVGSAGLAPIAQAWNGHRWAVAAGAPVHAHQGEFLAVSCLRRRCVAVGDVYRWQFVGLGAVLTR